MINVKTITLSGTMPLHKMISEAARQIRKWVQSYEKEFDPRSDQLRLAGFEEDNGLRRIHYEYHRRDSASLPEEDAAEKEAEV
jgi:hypothetical protein